MRKKLVGSLVGGLLLLAGTLCAFGQETRATLGGKVTDRGCYQEGDCRSNRRRDGSRSVDAVKWRWRLESPEPSSWSLPFRCECPRL